MVREVFMWVPSFLPKHFNSFMFTTERICWCFFPFLHPRLHYFLDVTFLRTHFCYFSIALASAPFLNHYVRRPSHPLL